MGIRLEFVLITVVIGIISGSFMLKIDNTPVSAASFTKEAEFTDTTLIEVDTADMRNRMYGTYGVMDKGVLTLHNIRYQGNNIESLSAIHGRLEDHMLYLDGDVEIQEEGGYKYETQHAVYNRETEILNITSPFIGVKGNNVIKGTSMEYDTRQKKASGTTVDTIFYTPDK
ncbi:MAG TPA: LPS export ABC transporter periplasmic protein LptC [Sulfurovum sp.]|uniref:LPS export ABC transporter periplasmic protein LptC n=1 Tax=Sulfurovum sp. TaxID=1969726 RepID=UPI002F92D051